MFFFFPFPYQEIQFPDTFQLQAPPSNPLAIWVPAVVTILASIISAIIAVLAMRKSAATTLLAIETRVKFDKTQADAKEVLDKQAIERKEAFDVKTALQKRQSEYHLQRKEHLAKLIGSLIVCEACYQEAKNIHNEMKYQGLLTADLSTPALRDARAALGARYVEYQAKGNDSLLEATIEAEQYGDIPKEFGLEDERLSIFTNIVGHMKLKKLYDLNLKAGKYEDIGRHLDSYVADLRSLIKLEEDFARHCTSGSVPKIDPSTIPYITKLDSLTGNITYDVSKLDWEDI